MSSLVKNQIAKQLARFTKNLSPNKISVKFLKGEGELHNLELDETTLSELLELPPWIRLTKAVCNRISAKIHWTRLKTDPICLYLDCVEISMEAVDEDVNSSSAPQQQFVHTPHPPPKEKAPNRYGFVEKVVDGMFVQINSVVISFKFQAFRATFQMSRLYIQSTNPNWKADDLRMTRVKDEARGEVLTFKQVTWSTLRIDANALYDENSDQQSAPVRLITSHSSLRITIKKRLEDCAVLSARLELLLDDILWVFTQSQLQALAGLLHSVTQAMSQTSRQKGPGTNPGQPAGQVSQQQQMHYTSSKVHESKSDIESLNALFTAHDVRETCYHLRTGSIDIHLCDDSDQNAGGDGGAMHLQMNKLSVDYYPYHLAGTSRTDWPSHNEASLTRAYWVSQLLNAFRNSQKNRPMTPQSRAAQTPHRVSSDSCLSVDERDRPQNQASSLSAPSSPRVNPKRHNPSSPGQSSRQSGHSIRNNMRHPVFMLESCFVVRCEEFFVKPVTTSDVSKGETAAFLSSDKKALYLPTDMPAFQLDFTRYYYPGTVCSPVPCPNMFIQLNPIQMTMDTATCLWINSFFQSILGQRTWSIGSPQQPNQSSSHIDIRIEALMPKIVIPCPCDPSAPYKESRPQALQLQASQVFITNSRTGYKCTQTDMLMFLQQFLGSKVYNDYHNFPACNSDARPLPNSAWVNDNSLLASDGKIDRLLNGVCSDVFDTHQPSQVWCLSAEQVWLDFLGIEETKNRPVSFVDAVPIQMWIATPLPSYDSSSSNVNSQVKRPHSASPLSSPTHRRTVSEVISTRRKASEPLLDRKLLGSTTAQSIVTSYAKGLHNSVPSLSPSPVNNTTPKSPDNLSAVDGPPPAYELGNEEHKTAPAGGDPPPPYEALTHNGPVSLVASPEEAPPLPEKAPLPESLLNDFTKPDTQSHEETEPASTADMSLLIHVPHCVSLQLDHFQFVFLLRLQEMLVKLQQDLEKDKLTHSDDSGSSESRDSQPTLFFSILAREVDLNIVLPPAPDRDASRLERDPSQNTSRNASSLSSYLDTGVVSDSGCQSPDVADFKSHSRADSDGGPPRRDGLLSPSADRTSRSGQEQLSSPRPSSPQSVSHTSGRASASSAPDSDSWLMVGGSDKSSTGHPRSRTESYASNSINQLQSSASKDSNSKEIEKEPKDHKMVSIFSIEGEEVEIGIHFQGYDKVVKLICPEIKLEELGVINFEKYVNQKALRKSLTKTTLYPLSEITPMVRMRAEFGPSADRFEPTAGERGFAHIKANGINGNLLVSTLGSLADCFEDEVLFPPMPFLVELNNSSVSINNDLPPALISAPLPIPVDLNIENISVRRAHTGVFQIRPTGSDSHTCSSEQVSAPITRQVSISASQLSLSDSASVCSRAESLENEKQCLVAQMSVSRATLQSLQDERDALLKTIERLQQELSFSNREQDLLQEKMTSFQRGGRRGYR